MSSNDPRKLVTSIHEGALGRFRLSAHNQHHSMLSAMSPDVLQTICHALTLMRVLVRVARDQLGSPGAMMLLAGMIWEFVRTTQHPGCVKELARLSDDALQLYRRCISEELQARGISEEIFAVIDTLSQPIEGKQDPGPGQGQGQGQERVVPVGADAAVEVEVEVAVEAASDAVSEISIDVDLVLDQARRDGLGDALANAEPTQVTRVDLPYSLDGVVEEAEGADIEGKETG